MHMSYLRIIVKMRIFERKWNTTLKKCREIVRDIFLPFFFSFFSFFFLLSAISYFERIFQVFDERSFLRQIYRRTSV